MPEAAPGDRVAVLAPAFAAPAVSAAVHEQAMQRLRELTGLVPVEFPTTRQLGASAQARAADVTAAFADPTIRAEIATVGGDDQITLAPHLDRQVIAASPKPFLGYSDNTDLHNLLWSLGSAPASAIQKASTPASTSSGVQGSSSTVSGTRTGTTPRAAGASVSTVAGEITAIRSGRASSVVEPTAVSSSNG
ncbi:LD-carboxypeptidase [Brachybacterium sp. AOP43-C2-M15]|uniref:LD-carboxypeptidase n=1 Tax=Brachybacterium sp. AOP43-C2-M15 TaxID=3457661 RepID=UPI00403367CC